MVLDWSVMKKALIVPISAIFALTMAVSAQAKVEYHLNKVENPSEDELDAYKRISAAMDSAVYMYNKYTHMSKHIEVYYNTGVQTADASYNGTMRFGAGRAYMNVRTAMHEMGHTMGMGTTSEYRDMLKDGVFQGETAQAKLKELTGDPTAVLKGDSQHFWPYGLNYDSELHSEQDLIIHCQIVEAMYQDIFKEKFYMTARVKSLTDGKCIGRTSTNGLEMMDCSGEETEAKIWSIGDNPVTYRFEYGDRVIDVPNESTAAGVTLGTYSWNAGAHQRYVLEEAPVNTPNAFYLQNYKSKLYMLPSGKNIVQDQRNRDINSGVWIFVQVAENGEGGVGDTTIADTTARDTTGTTVGDTTESIRKLDRVKARLLAPNPQQFDLKGRALGRERALNASRRQTKYIKIFEK